MDELDELMASLVEDIPAEPDFADDAAGAAGAEVDDVPVVQVAGPHLVQRCGQVRLLQLAQACSVLRGGCELAARLVTKAAPVSWPHNIPPRHGTV